MKLPSESTVVKVVAVALVISAFLALALSDNPFVDGEEPEECTEHSGVLYLDNGTVKNTTDGSVNITFTVCDQTGPFNGSTGEP